MPTKTKENKKNKKLNKKQKKVADVVEETKEDKFSFDQEIVIGLKRLDEPKPVNKKKKLSKKEKKRLKQEKRIKAKQKKRQNDTYYDAYSRKNIKQKRNDRVAYKGAQNSKTQKNNMQNDYNDYTDDVIKNKYLQDDEDLYEERYSNTNISANSRNTKNRENLEKRKNVKPKNKNTQLTERQKLAKKRRKFVIKICKWLTLFCIIIGGIIYAMLSPIFNITSIEVSGNSKISSETILSLSGLSINQNMFNFSTSQVRNNIKQNAYIESVEISRSLPDKVEITVEERVATYALTIGNAYAYINNQGYILEITSNNGSYPIISGYETPVEQIKEGSRLVTDDLEKLNDVLRIMEAVSIGDNNISELITQINIADKTNYILTLEKEKKTIYLGDTSNLSTKVLLINQILKEEKDNEGTIYLNVNLNTESPYFRETV